MHEITVSKNPRKRDIRIYDATNPRIDYIFEVNEEDVEAAKDLLVDAYYSWHVDSKGQSICDALQDALEDADICYFCFDNTPKEDDTK